MWWLGVDSAARPEPKRRERNGEQRDWHMDVPDNPDPKGRW